MAVSRRFGAFAWGSGLALVLTACVARPSDDGMEQGSDESTGPMSGPGSSATTGVDPTVATPMMTSADTGSTSSMTTLSTSATQTTGPMPTLSHEIDIQPIWNEHCIPCHSPGGEWEFIDLAMGAAYGSIVGVNSTQTPGLSFIEPGDPEASYLWHKINGTAPQAGGGGLQMPKGQGAMPPTVLTPEQFVLLEEWILQGAPP